MRPLVLVSLATTSLAGLCLHAYRYLPYISDDALISLRYAGRLAAGKGLTWTDGHAVEGYSNLLWVLLTSLFSLSGVDEILSLRIMGVGCMWGVCLLLCWYYARQKPLVANGLSLFCGLAFFISSGSVGLWSVGGLEQPLYVLLLTGAALTFFTVIDGKGSSKHRYALLSACLGLLCLTRPDGPLFVVVVISIYVLMRPTVLLRRTASEAVVIASLPVCFVLGQLTFRMWYYDSLVPNTALVKIAPSLHHTLMGLDYLKRGAVSSYPFVLLGLISTLILLMHRQTRARGFFLLLAALCWSAYITIAGGDIFPAFRQLLPISILLTIGLIEGLTMVFTKLRVARQRQTFLALTVFCLLLAFGAHLRLQLYDREFTDPHKELWEWDGKVVGLMLKDAFADKQPRIAVTAAGCIPYWSELPSLDMLGLNDYYLARHPPKDFGQGVLGHELGSGEYVMREKPDMIAFHIGSRTMYFRTGAELKDNPEFHRAYQLAALQGQSPYTYDSVIWMRKDSAKVGMRIENDGMLFIPAYFFFRHQPSDTAYALNPDKVFASSLSGNDTLKTYVDKSLLNGALLENAANPDVSALIKDEGGRYLIEVRPSSATPIIFNGLTLRLQSSP